VRRRSRLAEQDFTEFGSWRELCSTGWFTTPRHQVLVCRAHGYAISNLVSHLADKYKDINMKIRNVIAATYSGLQFSRPPNATLAMVPGIRSKLLMALLSGRVLPSVSVDSSQTRRMLVVRRIYYKRKV
jgi:hypothetical protein